MNESNEEKEKSKKGKHKNIKLLDPQVWIAEVSKQYEMQIMFNQGMFFPKDFKSNPKKYLDIAVFS